MSFFLLLVLDSLKMPCVLPRIILSYWDLVFQYEYGNFLGMVPVILEHMDIRHFRWLNKKQQSSVIIVHSTLGRDVRCVLRDKEDKRVIAKLLFSAHAIQVSSGHLKEITLMLSYWIEVNVEINNESYLNSSTTVITAWSLLCRIN